MTKKIGKNSHTSATLKSINFKESSMKKVESVGEFLVSLTVIAVWFVAIFMVACSLGWFLHYMQEHATWMPSWMFSVGTFIEYFLFMADCVCLVFAVGKELHQHFFEHKEGS